MVWNGEIHHSYLFLGAVYRNRLGFGHPLWIQQWSRWKRLREGLERVVSMRVSGLLWQQWEEPAFSLPAPSWHRCPSFSPAKQAWNGQAGDVSGCGVTSTGLTTCRKQKLSRLFFNCWKCFFFFFSPNAFTFFSSINIVGAFSLRYTFFDIIQELGQGEGVGVDLLNSLMLSSK